MPCVPKRSVGSGGRAAGIVAAATPRAFARPFAAFALFAALLASATSAVRADVTYVAHLMPWFDNTTAANHWCDFDYGNSYYRSVFGRYNSADPVVIRRQLWLMKLAGLDGVWIDLQFSDWLPTVEAIVGEVTALGMNFAIVVDNYADPGLVESVAEELQDFMAMPNYYRVFGRALLPYYEHPERWGPALLPSWLTRDGHHMYIIGTYSAHPEDEPLPAGYDSLFFWVTPDLNYLESYYRSTRFGLKVGSIYRGWHEAYRDRKHVPPFHGFLPGTLELARKHQPYFVQLVTWNDYGEGTMLEPSFLRDYGGHSADKCGDPAGGQWYSQTRTCSEIYGQPTFTDGGRLPPCLQNHNTSMPCSGSGEAPCAAVLDCSKPIETLIGPSAAGCAPGRVTAFNELEFIARSILPQGFDNPSKRFQDIINGDEPQHLFEPTTTPAAAASPRRRHRATAATAAAAAAAWLAISRRHIG